MKKFLLLSLIAANFGLQAADDSKAATAPTEFNFTYLKQALDAYNGNELKLEDKINYFHLILSYMEQKDTIAKKNVAEIELLLVKLALCSYENMLNTSLDKKILILKDTINALTPYYDKLAQSALGTTPVVPDAAPEVPAAITDTPTTPVVVVPMRKRVIAANITVGVAIGVLTALLCAKRA